MNFLKKIFGKKEAGNYEHKEGVFTCESCGQEQDESKKKPIAKSSGEEKRNVCEYC